MSHQSLTIYAVADIHGCEDRLERIAHHATALKPDVIVIAGDITDHHASPAYIRRINDLPVPVLMIRGNMDTRELDRLIEPCPNIVSLNMREWTIKGSHFVGLDGTTSMMPFSTDKASRGKAIETLITDDTILVTHQPPHGTLDEGFANLHAGSRSLRRLILKKQPKVLICGHIHEKPGWAFIDRTLVVNCSMGQSGVGALIVLKLNEVPVVQML